MNDEPTLQVYANGTKAWYWQGELHRRDGPAVEWVDGYKEWWLHGKLHRVHGPAIEWEDGATAWYLHNNHYANAQDWAEALLMRQNKPNDAMAVDAFLKQILKKNIEHAL